MITKQLPQRVKSLEELMAELTMTVAQTSRALAASEEKSRQQNEALREHIANVSSDLRGHINNLVLDTRLADERARKSENELRQNLSLLSRDMREMNEKSRQAEEELRENVSQLSSEMKDFKDEMKDFKDEMKDFKDEMKDFKVEGEKQRRHLNKKMAEMSHKMGTLAEDLIGPSIPRILKTIIKCTEEPEMVGLRIRKRFNNRNQEYDCLAVCGDYVLICEVKSRLRPEQVRDFRAQLMEARDFLPEYADKQIIGALGTFYVDPSLIKHGQRQGLIMLGVIDGLMTILNENSFVPQTF